MVAWATEIRIPTNSEGARASEAGYVPFLSVFASFLSTIARRSFVD